MSLIGRGYSTIADGTGQPEIAVSEFMDDIYNATDAKVDIAMADTNQTVNATQLLKRWWKCTGALTANRNLVTPEATEIIQIVTNATSGGYNIVVTCGGATISIVPGSTVLVYSDGTDVVQLLGDETSFGLVSGSTYTQTYNTADRTVAAYTTDDESGAYTGIDNAQGGTPYAQLTDLNALRAAYTNLEAAHTDVLRALTALIDDLQAVGIVS